MWKIELGYGDVFIPYDIIKYRKVSYLRGVYDVWILGKGSFGPYSAFIEGVIRTRYDIVRDRFLFEEFGYNWQSIELYKKTKGKMIE